MPRALALSRNRGFYMSFVERLLYCASASTSTDTCPADSADERCFSIASGSYSHRIDDQRPGLLERNRSNRFARGRSSSSSRSKEAMSRTSDSPPSPASVEHRAQESREILDRHSRDVLSFHPIELLVLNTALPPLIAIQRKAGQSTPSRHQLAIITRRPTEQREEVHHRLGR
jgi:hypothetical protein